MDRRAAIIQRMIPRQSPSVAVAKVFAPANIALIKYWGKRDVELNCPMTDSISLSLGNKGTTTQIKASKQDIVYLNDQVVASTTEFYQRLFSFLDLFRPAPDFCFHIDTWSNIPVASGLASSASGFAALTLALDQFFGWNLSRRLLSVIARMGSGSASRSLWPGFVIWRKGEQSDGLDSFAEPLDCVWPDLRLALVKVTEAPKLVSSRLGMLHCQQTSPFYALWPACVAKDLDTLQTAMAHKDFVLLGETMEANAIAMHALARTARPIIEYSDVITYQILDYVRQCRSQGLAIYATQDAGPHIKLLFKADDETAVRHFFPTSEVINPFETR